MDKIKITPQQLLILHSIAELKAKDDMLLQAIISLHIEVLKFDSSFGETLQRLYESSYRDRLGIYEKWIDQIAEIETSQKATGSDSSESSGGKRPELSRMTVEEFLKSIGGSSGNGQQA